MILKEVNKMWPTFRPLLLTKYFISNVIFIGWLRNCKEFYHTSVQARNSIEDWSFLVCLHVPFWHCWNLAKSFKDSLFTFDMAFSWFSVKECSLVGTRFILKKEACELFHQFQPEKGSINCVNNPDRAQDLIEFQKKEQLIFSPMAPLVCIVK